MSGRATDPAGALLLRRERAAGVLRRNGHSPADAEALLDDLAQWYAEIRAAGASPTEARAALDRLLLGEGPPE